MTSLITPRRSQAAQTALDKSVAAVVDNSTRMSNILWLVEQHPLIQPNKNKRVPDIVHTIIVLKQPIGTKTWTPMPLYSISIGRHRYRASETRFPKVSEDFVSAGFRCIQVKLEIEHKPLPWSSYLTKNKEQIWVLWPGKLGRVFQACRRLRS